MPDGLNVVVDISHHNGDVDFTALKNAGIAAVPLPHDVSGVGLFDRDLFNGTADQLKAFWGT